MPKLSTEEAWGYIQKKKKEKGYIQLRTYFLDISKTQGYIDCIKKLRKKYNIPNGGFSKTDHTDYLKWSRKYRGTYWEKVSTDVHKLCKKFFFPKEWQKAIMESVFHDSKDISDLEFGTTSGMCIVSDLTQKRRSDFPVSIEINPYASQRAIIDFIKISFTNEIEPRLEHYRNKNSKVGKYRSKNVDIQKRDDFIYKNQHIPRKELIKMVEKKFGRELSEPINQGSIGKIILIENKKRKDV